MIKCNICQKKMAKNSSCLQYVFIKQGNKIRWFERDTTNHNIDVPCGDCNAKAGEYHHFGCDLEYCPACGEQIAFCDCQIVGFSNSQQ